MAAWDHEHVLELPEELRAEIYSTGSWETALAEITEVERLEGLVSRTKDPARKASRRQRIHELKSRLAEYKSLTVESTDHSVDEIIGGHMVYFPRLEEVLELPEMKPLFSVTLASDEAPSIVPPTFKDIRIDYAEGNLAEAVAYLSRFKYLRQFNLATDDEIKVDVVLIDGVRALVAWSGSQEDKSQLRPLLERNPPDAVLMRIVTETDVADFLDIRTRFILSPHRTDDYTGATTLIFAFVNIIELLKDLKLRDPAPNILSVVLLPGSLHSSLILKNYPKQMKRVFPNAKVRLDLTNLIKPFESYVDERTELVADIRKVNNCYCKGFSRKPSTPT